MKRESRHSETWQNTDILMKRFLLDEGKAYVSHLHCSALWMCMCQFVVQSKFLDAVFVSLVLPNRSDGSHFS